MGFWTGKSGWDMSPHEERRAQKALESKSTLKRAREIAAEVAREKARAKGKKLRKNWLGF